ncbi:MarR family winged helix-turn-helix transcriptional regulator [Pseudoalteromonas tunicata]|jgi:DNA-binding MarR family transcriptional regulator|uniref:Putative bacterial regulatory protein, MarR family protein n=1 Tax=Pseudoalteromonas tunicata D2 TaxID=87626 RepID=A4C4V3_9GAMM|nr:MarR family transcriptional regulator [Pseudoalteromonas tunicata]ATC96936.1 hypothetical protein PTUN_b0573 [Pseudoalteromonas tunicata]AXT33066.1 MarR family transcriptional regulator [Pseudoalteromonas tunicata]EAR30585.1 putative bacterial regulatory protein, MarR family protein [Pseudoalteromonas tunicata D2]MDP4983941.1 MarR family transcriptional regulator [Pseudoalteromonas tunicata]MDP5213940.1 MarR family transcriptional regulator [Pseudoalteromonas tunicata]
MTLNAIQSLHLQHFLPYRLSQLTAHVSETFAKVYQDEYQLSIPEWRILVNLAEKKSSNAKELGECAVMDKSTVSRTIKLLQQKNYVEKITDENDKRASLLTLSRQGNALYQELVPKALAWEAQLLAVLSAPEYRDLMSSIDKLEQQLLRLKDGI